MAKLPTVAIIGRPNTGKSTLFNRLVGRRKAIVSEIPGTTRDHVASKVETPQLDYLLVDTGGMGGGTEDEDMEDEVIDDAHDLDAVLKIPTYEELKKLVEFGVDDGEEDDPPPKSRRRSRKKEEKEDDDKGGDGDGDGNGASDIPEGMKECRSCEGSGEHSKDPDRDCRICKGNGYVKDDDDEGGDGDGDGKDNAEGDGDGDGWGNWGDGEKDKDGDKKDPPKSRRRKRG